jgi:ABC-2 type transport system permease protein
MAMSPARTYAIVLRQAYLIRGSSARVLPLFAWVAVDMLLWGFITRYLTSVTAPGLNLVFSLLGAVLLWDFLVRVMQGVTMAFLEDVWSRNFLNFFSTPLSVTEYLAGLVLSSIATSAIGLVVMLVLATTIFGLSFAAYGLAIVPSLLILFACGIALGILGSAIVMQRGPSAEWFIWPLPAMLSPFAGVFYPVATLPAWMQGVAKAMPPAYVFEGMRAVVAGGPSALGTLAWGGGLAVLYVLLACWFFARTYRRAVRTGALARYSAETVS